VRLVVRVADLVRSVTHWAAVVQLEAAVVSGAIMGGATDREVEQLRQYARDIGLAFQVLLMQQTLKWPAVVSPWSRLVQVALSCHSTLLSRSLANDWSKQNQATICD